MILELESKLEFAKSLALDAGNILMYHFGNQKIIRIKSRVDLVSEADLASEKIIINAVKGMLPRNKLGRKLLTHLKVFSGDIHPHSSQKPKTITF